MKRGVLATVLVLGVLAAATAFGIFAYRGANAAAGLLDLAQGRVMNDGLELQGRGGPGGKPGLRSEQTQQDLADALGITLEELQAAQQKANEAMIAAAVDQGLITQAQADAMLSGNGGMFGGRMGGMGGWLQESGLDFQTFLAEALGISVEDLQAAQLAAHNAAIDRAVAEGTLTAEQADLIKGQHALFSSEGFRSAMQTAFEAAVQQAVSDGVITQAQADAILASGAGAPGLRGPCFGGPGFGGHGRGGPGGFPGMPGGPDAPAAPANPTSPGQGG